MTPCINLVATRCKNGDHHSLLRWYNDHVHLLMGFPGLLQATLFRQSGTPPSTAPEYACVYEFASHADFLAFEHSDARERARQVVETGWARTGIEITQRTQYLRLGARAAGIGHAGDGASFVLQSLSLGPAEASAAARWLSDSLYQALAALGDNHCAWYRAADATASGGDALVVAQLPVDSGMLAFASAWWDGAAGPQAVGAPPEPVAAHWQAPYRRLLQWQR